MDIDTFRSQLEAELEWRTSEIRFFVNTCESVAEVDQDRFRRALVLLLYSHFEGYCKFALTLYAGAVNSIGLQCSEANSAVVAASLHKVLAKLRDPNVKSNEFRNELPDDSKLHRFALEREFIERASEIMAGFVCIPEDAVDTESNLKPVVLRKNLFKLGLPHEQFADLDGDINRLLELRNKISHGATASGVARHTFDKLRESAMRVMTSITVEVTRALSDRAYLMNPG